ncbi:MAG: hypothetical protein Q8O55_10870 [Dehalococcoidales bacterium]|nr:hypothetical protein [Dehalococcoidales bacterium]
MRGIKVFLFISFVISVVYGLVLLFMPGQMAEIKMGPQDAPSARYMGATFIALAVLAWYAFRNPAKNVAAIRAFIVAFGLSALVGLFNGITGAEEWGLALTSVIFGVILAGGLLIFTPKGEKAT